MTTPLRKPQYRHSGLGDMRGHLKLALTLVFTKAISRQNWKLLTARFVGWACHHRFSHCVSGVLANFEIRKRLDHLVLRFWRCVAWHHKNCT